MNKNIRKKTGEEPVYFVSDSICAFHLDAENVSINVAGRSVEDIIQIMVFMLSFEKTKQAVGKISKEDFETGKKAFGIK